MEKPYILGVDLGGTAVKLAILSRDGGMVEKWSIATDKTNGGENIVPQIAASFFEKCSELHLSREQFIGVGMGAPGPVVDESVVTRAVNVGWVNYPLKEKLMAAIGLPAFIGNDANCAAAGELWIGAAKGMKNVICLTLGTGVGGGVIVDGKIVEGITGGAGEIGHMTVQMDGGELCSCGKRGCLETIASGKGAIRLAMERLKDPGVSSGLRRIYEENQAVTAKDVFDQAAEGDPVAREIVEEIVRYLGYGIGALCSIFNPEAIVIGGGLSNAGKTLIDPLHKYVEQFAFPATAKDTKILLAKLGNDAGVIGAGYLVAQHFKEPIEM